ncbi:PASTA domain-containing protein [Micromonospora pisi]|uniref:PASTA domain-containing protein n=1 Tax=Micromonospora pisi TaxID=589240 RepID=A0A495JUI4_9ACTN|nr:PASTA domain-containing protein [Micromonospora pisi]RKR92677.1 PASTA domain-containing protein [Micromonospora pisi]
MPQPHAHGPQQQTSRTALIVFGVAGVLILCGGAVGIVAALGEDPVDPAAQPLATSTPASRPPAAPAATAAAPQVVPTVEPVTSPTVAAPSSAAPAKTAAPKTLTVPTLVGKNAAVADDELRKLGFTNISFGSQDKNDTVVILLTNWTVTKQSTKAGAKVAADTLIVLTCTKE